MDAHPIVPDSIERHHVDVAFELFREGVRQAGKAAIVHTQRQREGIDAAKAAGKYHGGKQTVDRLRVWQLIDGKTTKAEIARQLECSEMSVYRIIKEGRPKNAAEVR